MTTDITVGPYDTILPSTAVFPRGLVAMSALQAISLYQVISSGDTFAQVLDISGNVVTHAGTPAQVDVGASPSTLVRLTDTKALVVYSGVAKVVDITGSDLSVGSYYVVTAGSPNAVKLARLSDTQAILVYVESSQVKCAVLTVSGTAVSVGAAYIITPSGGNYPRVTALSATQAVVTYQGSSGTDVRVLDIAGTVVTVTNPEAALDPNGGAGYPVVRLLDTQAISIHRDSVSLNASAVVLNTSGPIVTPGTPITNVATDVYSGYLDAAALTGSNILIAYCDFNNGNQAEARILSDTGATLGTVSVVGAPGDGYPMVAALSNAKVIMTVRATGDGSGNEFKAIILETDPPAAPVEPPMSVPIPVITGIMYGGARMSGTLPMITGVFNGRLHKSNALEGALPMMVGTMRGGAQLVAVLPAMTGLMTARVSTAGRLVGVLPVMTGVMRGSNSGAGVLEGTLPMMIGAMRGGGQLVGVLPMMTGLMVGSRNTTGVLIGTLPMMTGLMAGTQQITGALVGILPMLVSSGFGSLIGTLPMISGVMRGGTVEVLVFEAYAINLNPSNKQRTHEVTHYTNMPFTGIVRWQGNNYGWGPGGLYLIGGATDDGAAIPWTWHTAITNFGSRQQKALRETFLHGRLGPTVSASVSIGEAADVTYAAAIERGRSAQAHRVKYGRGLKAEYWSFGLADAASSDMEIDSMQHEPQPLSRKI